MALCVVYAEAPRALDCYLRKRRKRRWQHNCEGQGDVQILQKLTVATPNRSRCQHLHCPRRPRPPRRASQIVPKPGDFAAPRRLCTPGRCTLRRSSMARRKTNLCANLHWGRQRTRPCQTACPLSSPILQSLLTTCRKCPQVAALSSSWPNFAGGHERFGLCKKVARCY